MNSPPLEMVLDQLGRYVGKRFGPVTRASHWSFENVHAPLFCFVADVCKDFATNIELVPNPAASGQSTDEAHALASTLAEALERYCGCLIPSTLESKFSSYRTLREAQEPVLMLDEYQSLRPQQLGAASKLKRFSEDENIRWIKGVGHSQAKNGSGDVWHPISLLALHPKLTLPFYRGNSNGFALGSSADHAKLSGLLEHVERDGVLWHWWTRTSPRHFRLDDLVEHMDDVLYEALAPLRDQIWILDLSTRWHLPLFCLVIVGDRKRKQPAVFWSSACHPDPRYCLDRCLKEGLRVFSMFWSELVRAPKQAPFSENFDDSILSLDDIRNLGAYPESALASRFLLQGDQADWASIEEKAIRVSSLSERLSQTIQRLANRGARAYFFDFTAEELRTTELQVWKTVIPECVPLNLSHDSRPWGCLALRDFSFSSLNSYPHLFF